MHSLRALILSFAALAMIATGVAVGMARGAMAADGQFCSVTGPSPVVLAHDGLPLFDAEGAPVTLDRSACLDCLISPFDLPDRASVPSCGLALSPAVMAAILAVLGPAHLATVGQARAPPQAG